MNLQQLTSTPTKQHLLNEEIQKMAMKTHLEVQQRENIRRDLAERMKFVPPDLRAGDDVEGQMVVCELFSDNSYLNAILDRQGLLLQGLWQKLKKINPKIVVMSPTLETKSFKKKEVVWQQHHLCMDVAEHQILGGNTSLFWDHNQERSGG